MKPHIVDFLEFLESKENKVAPIEAKLLYPDKFSPITKEELNVKGDLSFQETGITTLPDNLTVEGDLDLYEAAIQSLPDNLKVGGFLDMSGTRIRTITDNLIVDGSLYLQGTKIESLPNNLKIGEDLYIYDTPLAKRMSTEEIRQEIERKGGYVKGDIYSVLYAY